MPHSEVALRSHSPSKPWKQFQRSAVKCPMYSTDIKTSIGSGGRPVGHREVHGYEGQAPHANPKLIDSHHPPLDVVPSTLQNSTPLPTNLWTWKRPIHPCTDLLRRFLGIDPSQSGPMSFADLASPKTTAQIKNLMRTKPSIGAYHSDMKGVIVCTRLRELLLNHPKSKRTVAAALRYISTVAEESDDFFIAHRALGVLYRLYEDYDAPFGTLTGKNGFTDFQAAVAMDPSSSCGWKILIQV